MTKPEYRSPSKEIKEFNDKKGGILNNSLKTFNDKFRPSNVLSPQKLTNTKICSIKIVKAYPNKKESIENLIQYSPASSLHDVIIYE